jgi:hypothetical protein
MTNPFDSEENTATTAEATEAAVTEAVLEEVDVDVDSGSTEDETETVDAPPTRKGNIVKVGEKAAKASSRPAVPEGFVSPVAAAKLLSEYLTKKAREAGDIGEDEAIEVKPQVVYSYIKNNGPESKNPIPTYAEGGRENLLKIEEFIAWWEAKDARVADRKANAKNKAEKKAANAEKAKTDGVTEAEDTNADAPPVVEAE